MVEMTQRETAFEMDLIHHLENIGGTKQWEYLPNINTVDQLWDNFRVILERNNQDKLKGHPLTDAEFAQVKRHICELKTPYEAGRFIYGLNGVTQIEVGRDDVESDGTSQVVYLTIFDQDQIGAGNTTYQIVNQVRRDHIIAGNQDRRFDTTLLINGLPIIHIEEKADKHDALEGLNQIRQYIGEGLFGDIYSTTQILVGITPHDARYMANTDASHFNTDFAFRWQREKDNKPVWQWREFCNEMLSIPMAHKMATNYIILDGAKDHKNLMVMRPYQVYATRRVINRLRTHIFGTDKQEVGYVWHTTGSGKTVSSFKTAWLASRLPNVDKVVFLVDRRSLTSQTYDNYTAYDPDTDENNNGGVISDTRNTNDLIHRLKSKGRANNIIVTSIQKMGNIAKLNKFEAVNKNIVFIVDEAHRSTNGDLFPLIKKKFPTSAWIGYTGTPAFDKDLTYKAFGGLIHAYTIREAIADRNVLGFQVDFEHTLSEDELKEKLLPNLIKVKEPSLTDAEIEMRIASMTSEEAESLVDSGVYDSNEKHIHAVVNDIIEHWNNRSAEGRYSAILTTHVRGGGSSAPMALMYFQEFQRANQRLAEEGNTPLNVALTYSMGTDNSADQYEKNKGLKEAISIYNAAFGTTFGADSVDDYFNDVMNRLAGKSKDGPKLDIVIVVDQLLTGYDSKILNTLYVDRVLSGANLIQAYSRTNRVQNMKKKPFGHIVNYRWPGMSKRLMDAALKIYANPDSAMVQGEVDDDPDSHVLAPTFQEKKEETSKIVDELRNLTQDFTVIPPSEAQQAKAAQLVDEYNTGIAALKQYKEYDFNHPQELLNELAINEEDHEWIIGPLRYELEKRAFTNVDITIDLSNLDFEAEHVTDVKVDYDYIDELLATLINQVQNNEPGAEKTYEDLKKATDRMDDRRHAEQINKTAEAAIKRELDVPGYPVSPDEVNGIVREHMANSRRSAVLQFRKKWGLIDVETSVLLINAMLDRHVSGKDDLDLGEELSHLLKAAVRDRYYKTDAESEAVRALAPIQYKKELRVALREFADKIVVDFN